MKPGSAFAVALAALVAAAGVTQCRKLKPGGAAGVRSLDDATRLTIVGLNDTHGTVEPRKLTFGNPGGATVTTEVGGLDALGAFLDAVRASNPEHTVVLDAGDTFQGSLVSNAAFGMPMVEAFNAFKVDMSTFGNHEFDYGNGGVPESGAQGALRRILRAAKYPYVSANVVAAPGTEPLPNTGPARLITVGGVRIGVVGATTASTPQQAKATDIAGFSFRPLAETVPDAAKSLRAQGAQLVVLLAHAGGFCDLTRPAEDGDKACVAPVADEITTFLDAVPKGTVDVILAGHMHLPQAHFIRGVPVLQTSGFASSFSSLDVWVDPQAPAYAPAEERLPKIEVHKPTYVCTQHFANYPSCNPDELAQLGRYPADFGAPVPPVYADKPVLIDPSRLAPVLAPFRQQVKELSEREIVTFPQALANDRTKESPASDCVADALREGTAERTGAPVDLVLMGSGGIRTAFPSGLARYGDVYSVLPFDNLVAVATLTGEELDTFAKTLSQTVKNIGVLSAGWKTRLAAQPVFPRHRGLVAPDGQPPAPAKTYTVATADFHALPGSENEAAFTKATAEGRIKFLSVTLRDVVAERLAKKGAELPEACSGRAQGRAELVP